MSSRTAPVGQATTRIRITRRAFRSGLLAASVVIATTARALPENPLERTGNAFLTNTDVGPDGSSVSIFSGGLSLFLPLHSLSVGGNVSMSLPAAYSSKSVWRLNDNGSPDQWDDFFEFIGNHELGAGWRMAPGRVVNRWVPGLGTTVQYLFTPEGTPHRLYRLGGNSGPNHQFITRDGTFFRAIWTSDNTYKVFRPDGTILEFGHRSSDQQDFQGLSYYLSTVVDVFGNRVSLVYHDAPHGNVVKSMTDSHGRSIRTTLIPDGDPSTPPLLRGLVAGLTYDGFGGAPAAVTFTYEVRSVRAPPVYGGTTPDVDMPLLTKITLAEPGLVEEFDYNTFGELSRHFLPTGAAAEFQYGNFFITPPGLALGRGLENRYVFLDGNPANLDPANRFQWTFWRSQIQNPGCPPAPDNYLVRVRNPEMTWTFYYFARRTGDGVVPETELLEKEVLYAPATPSLDACFDPPPGVVPYRTRTFKWQIDDFPDSIIDQNPRCLEVKEVLHADSSGTRIDQCGWNGIGSSETRVARSADVSPAHPVTRVQRAHVTPILCQWILHVESHRNVSEGGQKAVEDLRYSIDGQLLGHLEARDYVQADYDPAECDNSGLGTITVSSIGRTFEQQFLVPPENWPDQTNADNIIDPEPPAQCMPPEQLLPLSPLPGDVLTSFAYYGSASSGTGTDPHGHAAWGATSSVTISGGDITAPPWTQDYTWAFGVIESAQWRAFAWKLFDNTIDAPTGLVSAHREPGGMGASYAYDLMGRQTLESPFPTIPPPAFGPVTEAPTRTVFDPGDARNVTILRRADGAPPEKGTETYLTQDTLGRLDRVETRQPDGRLAAVITRHDVFGRLAFRSEAVPGGPDPRQPLGTVPGCRFKFGRTIATGAFVPDPLGRVGEILAADGALATFIYTGRDSTVSVTGVNGDPAQVATQTIRRDALGRVRKVDTPAGQADVTYTYDLSGGIASADLDGQVRTWVYDALGHVRSASSPESGTTSYLAYDGLGKLRSEVQDGGITQVSVYDAAGRPTYIGGTDPTCAPTCAAVWYTYDGPGYGQGRVASTSSDGFSASYTFGGLSGRLSAVAYSDNQSPGAPTWNALLQFDALGLPERIFYPTLSGSGWATVVRHSYRYGQLVQMGTDGQPAQFVSNVSYGLSGEALVQDFANGVQERVDLDVRSRPSRISTKLGGLVQWDSGVHSYDAVSNLISLGPTVERGADSFQYDLAGRLTGATYSGVGQYGFGWDAWGNMTASTLQPSGPPCLPGGFSDRQYRMGPDNMPVSGVTNRISVFGSDCPSGFSPEYDRRGNMLRDERAHYVYDALNRLREIRDPVTDALVERIEHDATGGRVRREKQGIRTFFLRAPDGTLLSEWLQPLGGGTPQCRREFVYEGDAPRVLRDWTGGSPQDLWLHSDHLGSMRAVTDASGSLVGRYDFAPFGTRLARAGGPGNPDYACFALHAADGDDERFDMHMRSFSGWQGRFLSADPANSALLDLGDSWNRYAYGLNNPLKYVDRLGLESEPTGEAAHLFDLFGYIAPPGDFWFGGVSGRSGSLTGLGGYGPVSFYVDGILVGGRSMWAGAWGSLTTGAGGSWSNDDWQVQGAGVGMGLAMFGGDVPPHELPPGSFGAAVWAWLDSGDGKVWKNSVAAVAMVTGGEGPAAAKVVQSSGHTLFPSTARAIERFTGVSLGNKREWGRLLEALKRDNGLAGSFHELKIRENGEVLLKKTGDVIDNLLNYLD